MNVGPPPISAIAQQEAPDGRRVAAALVQVAGQRRDDAEALGRVVQREADDQHGRQRDLAARGRLADGEALGEVVQADADGDQQRQSAGRGPGGDAARRPAAAPSTRHRAGARRARRRLAGAARSAVVGRPGRAGRRPGRRRTARRSRTTGAERRRCRRGSPPSAASIGSHAARQHVPDQEQQHADRDRVQHRAAASGAGGASARSACRSGS